MTQLTSVVTDNSVFVKPFNEALVHQVVVACLSNRRQGTHQQKTRAEVSGGGAKPWKQKGTGRARAGTIRSPVWRHGGKAFAARPGVYSQKINKKMYTGAIISIISQLIRDNRLLLVEAINLSEPKTKLLIDFLKKLNVSKPLIVVDKIDDNLALASRNLIEVGLTSFSGIDPVILLSYDNVVMTKDAFEKLKEVYKHDE
jgi:large subunit ribosomal protein L4